MKNLGKVKTLQALSPELKAYIYQQINDFIPFCLPDSNVNVFIEKASSKKEYIVKMVLTGGECHIEAEGRDKNIYKATSNAKENIFNHLIAIENAVVNVEERNKQIEFYLKNPKIH